MYIDETTTYFSNGKHFGENDHVVCLTQEPGYRHFNKKWRD
jgi:hypothetical protein